jgi:hypothetical protein
VPVPYFYLRVTHPRASFLFSSFISPFPHFLSSPLLSTPSRFFPLPFPSLSIHPTQCPLQPF